MTRVLVVGDSEVVAFSNAATAIYREYGLALTTSACPGRSLLKSYHIIQEHMSSDTQIVLMLGLTSFSWQRVELSNHKKLALVTDVPDADYEQIPEFMNKVILYCKAVNPNVQVYLVIPSIKDVYQFNCHLLKRAEIPEFKVDMDTLKYFNHLYLYETSLAVYQRQQKLNHDSFRWIDKKCLMMGHAFNKYFEKNNHVPLTSPHIKYLKRQMKELYISDLLYDGVHYTTQCIQHFLQANKFNCSWISPRLMVKDTSPMQDESGAISWERVAEAWSDDGLEHFMFSDDTGKSVFTSTKIPYPDVGIPSSSSLPWYHNHVDVLL